MSSAFPPTFPLSSEALGELVATSVPATDVASAGARSGMPTCVAIGAFDGVHLGHRRLIEACVSDAHARGLRALVVTFDPDPSEVLSSSPTEQRLLDVSDRIGFCATLGVDDIVTLRFDARLASQSPEAFVGLLEEEVGPLACVHVGENFRYGAGGAGTTATLEEIGARRGFAVITHPLLQEGGQTVSSTRIRALLEAGDVEQAAKLLGRCHFVRGMVEHGRGEGTSFGFPTANVSCDPRVCLPGEGVYACVVTDGVHAWPSAANVGAPPTFSGRRAAFLEANLIGFDGDLYGRDLAVVFLAWLRGSRTFDSLEELERTVLGNIDWVSRNVGSHGVEVSR